MKLRASISPLFTCGKRSISEAVGSIKLKLHFSNGDVSSNKCHAEFKYFVNSLSERRILHSGTPGNFQIQTASRELSLSFSRYGIQGVQKLKRSLHSSSSEEDNFSELGLPVPEGGGTRSKLVTEKPKAFLNSYPSIRSAYGIPLHGKNNPSMKTLPLKQGNHTPAPHLNVEGQCGVSSTKSNAKNIPTYNMSRSITLEKVPSTISRIQLMEEVSAFGEILNASVRTGPKGFYSFHVEFKRVESKERAVATQGITIKSFHLPIRSLHVPESITIRISNISMETAEPAIHSICMSCGRMEGLSRKKEGPVDVFFHVKDSSAMEGILKKLNDVFIDDCQWSAQLLVLPRVTTSTVMTDTADAQLKAGLQISNLLSDLRKQFHIKRICLEDLVDLHLTVVHLRDRPAC